MTWHDGRHTVNNYFSCILIWWFGSVEILLHFNLGFSQGVLCKVVPVDLSVMWTKLCITISSRYYSSRPIQNKKIFTSGGVDIQCRCNLVMSNLNFHGYFNFAVICYSRNSWKLYACKKLVFYSIYKWCYRRDVSFTDWWNRSVCLSTGPIHSSNWRLSNIDR